MGKKDYILLTVLYCSLLAGILFPNTSTLFSEIMKYLMMVLLFLSFIKISPSDVGRSLQSNWGGLLCGTVLRLIVAPAVAYWLTLFLYPPLALPILLLAGVSTGVSAPFFTSLCRGNISYTLVMAIVTSLILPVSLPLMVKFLTHAKLEYDLTSMAQFLAMIIFVPLGAAYVVKAWIPRLLKPVENVSYPLSLLMIAGINFGALGRYVDYLKANPEQVFYCGIACILLTAALAPAGWFSINSASRADRVAASGSQVWINNMVIIALAVHMNLPLAATLGIFYLIPFYGVVILFSVMTGKASVVTS